MLLLEHLEQADDGGGDEREDRDNPAATRKLLDGLPSALESGVCARSLPSAVDQLTTALMELNYYHEWGLAGFDHGVQYDV